MSDVVVRTSEGRFAFPDRASADKFIAAASKNLKEAPVIVTSSSDKPTAEDFADANTTTGADFMTRIGASFKMTDEGKLGYLKSKYGDANVFRAPDGEIYFREKPNARLTRFDERGLTLKDLADFAGDTPGIVLSTLGALGGTVATPGPGNVAGAAAGAAAGNAIKQNISNALPGDDSMSAVDRVVSMGTDAVLAGGTQYGVNKLVPLADLGRPSNVVALAAQKAVAAPGAQRVIADAVDTGIPVTTAEATGSKVMRSLEDFARRVPFVRDRFEAFDREQAQAAVTKINRVMDDLIPEAQTDLRAGQRMQQAFDDTLDRLVTMRREQARNDFGLVGKLSDGKPIIDAKNLRAEIRSLIEEFDVPGAGDANAALVNRAKVLLEEIKQPKPGEFAPQLTADQVNRLLQIYSKASAGKGAIFDQLDKAQQRMIGARLHRALESDLDSAVATMEKITSEPAGEVAKMYVRDPSKPEQIQQAGKIAEALKKARENYRLASEPINEVRDSVIGKYLGTETPRTPERIADAMLKMKPSEMQTAFRLLGSADPQLKEGTARLFVERALSNSTEQTADGVRFSAAKFLKALPDEDMAAVLTGGTAPGMEMKKVVNVLQRVAQKPAEGSQTAGRLITWSMLGGGGAALLIAEPISTSLGLGTTYLTANRIANAMLTPQGRQALTTLATTSEPTKRSLAAASYLIGQQTVGSGKQQ